MIHDVKVFAIVKQGKIINYRYVLTLMDDRGCLAERVLEVPEEGVSETKYLKQLRQYGASDLKAAQG